MERIKTIHLISILILIFLWTPNTNSFTRIGMSLIITGINLEIFLCTQTNYACYYNCSNPACIGLVQEARGLTFQQVLAKIGRLQALIDEDVLHIGHSPYKPIDLTVACFAELQFIYDEYCLSCDVCASHYPSFVCAELCPPINATISTLSKMHLSAATTPPQLVSQSPSRSGTTPFEHPFGMSPYQFNKLFLMLLIGAAIIIAVLSALLAVTVIICCMYLSFYTHFLFNFLMLIILISNILWHF